MDVKKITDFYDTFVEEQQHSGINDRIVELYRRLKKLGLNTNSNVLELGCGVGTMTYLLSKTVRRGSIEAVDISPKSIAFCRQRINKRNLRFSVGDVTSYTSSLPQFDFITLFDVIEHIPTEKHGSLFQNLSKFCGDNTQVVFNIPNPDYIEYDRVHHPEVLQIIDQPIPLTFIAENAAKSALELVYFETYSVWVQDDYQFFVMRKKKAFQEKFLHEKRDLFQKALKKLQRTFIMFRFNYR